MTETELLAKDTICIENQRKNCSGFSPHSTPLSGPPVEDLDERQVTLAPRGSVLDMSASVNVELNNREKGRYLSGILRLWQGNEKKIKS